MERIVVKDKQNRDVILNIIGRGNEKYVVLDTSIFQGIRRAPTTYSVEFYKLFAPVDLFRDMASRMNIDELREKNNILETVGQEELKLFKKANKNVVFEGTATYRMGQEHAADDAITRKNIYKKMEYINEIIGRSYNQHLQMMKKVRSIGYTDIEKTRINMLDNREEELKEKMLSVVSVIEKHFFAAEKAKEEGNIEEYNRLNDLALEMIPQVCEFCSKMDGIKERFDREELKTSLREGKERGDAKDKVEYKALLGNTGRVKQYEKSFEDAQKYRYLVEEEVSRTGIKEENAKYYQEWKTASEKYAQAKAILDKAREEKKANLTRHYGVGR